MNRLLGRLDGGKYGGYVTIQGEQFCDISHLQPGVVPQNDVMHSQLTVRQVLHYQLLLRNRLINNSEERQKFLDSVLLILEIDKIQHSIIGDLNKRGISGGEKKRVNIGMEIVAYPSMLFLDEPTSGLDSATTEIIMKVLTSLTSKKITIVAIIHQPRWRVFKMFDKVLLLKGQGEKEFFGDTSDVTDYFVSQGYQKPDPRENNLADWYIDILSGSVDNYIHFPGLQIYTSDADLERDDTRSVSCATTVWTRATQRTLLDGARLNKRSAETEAIGKPIIV